MAREQTPRIRSSSLEVADLRSSVAELSAACKRIDARLNSLDLYIKQQANAEKDDTALTKASIIRLMRKMGMIQ